MLMSASKRRASSVLSAVAFLACVRAVCQRSEDAARPSPEDIVIGRQLRFHSHILGETRPIQIHLPDNYQDSEEAYPVVFVLDGENYLQYCATIIDMVAPNYMPRMIIVGLPNTDRVRDLRPPNEPPTEGEAGTQRFLRFLEQELVPHIETRLGALPCRVLAGHSLAGLFTLCAWAQKPDLFRAYIASSPGLDAPGRRNLLLAGLQARTTDPVTR
jgi:predicted alpha/beta superfamily hydrolase